MRNLVCCGGDIAPPVVDWTRLPVGEMTTTELEVMARFEADVAGRISGIADPNASQVRLEPEGKEITGRPTCEAESAPPAHSTVLLIDRAADSSGLKFNSEPDALYPSSCPVEYTNQNDPFIETSTHLDETDEPIHVDSMNRSGKFKYILLAHD